MNAINRRASITLLKCHKCSRKFSSSLELLKHVAQDHSKELKKPDCKFCHKICATESALSVHEGICRRRSHGSTQEKLSVMMKTNSVKKTYSTRKSTKK